MGIPRIDDRSFSFILGNRCVSFLIGCCAAPHCSLIMPTDGLSDPYPLAYCFDPAPPPQPRSLSSPTSSSHSFATRSTLFCHQLQRAKRSERTRHSGSVVQGSRGGDQPTKPAPAALDMAAGASPGIGKRIASVGVLGVMAMVGAVGVSARCAAPKLCRQHQRTPPPHAFCRIGQAV